MNNLAVAIVLAGTAALVTGCNRTDTSASNSSTGPVTPSITASTPPALPAAPSTPTGSGSAEPATSPAASAAATPTPAAGGTRDGKASDTAGNNPTGSLTPREESTEMPKAGQANNHSSPAMEESRGQK
jgi:hypothetical protein